MTPELTAPETVTVQTTAARPGEPVLHRMLSELRRRKVASAGLLVFLAILLIALAAPVVAPHDPMKQNLGDNFLPPAWKDGGTWTYPFGTDPLGRDILTRLIYGARSSLIISIGAVFVGMVIGFATGLIAGFYGGRTDTTLMRLGDVQLAFPFVLFAIAILAVSPNRTVWHLMAVLGISSWVIYARVVRSRVLSERNKDYARAAQAVGASRWRVLSRYVLPNVWQSIVPIALLNLAYFVVVESLLSFISLGLSPPTPSWGSILADGRQYMMLDPWMALLPGFAIIITVLAIGLAADGFADLLDPKLTQGAFQRQPLTTLAPDIPPNPIPAGQPLLQVRDLSVDYFGQTGAVHAVREFSLDIAPAEVVGIVGESGSGKSTLGLAIMQLIDPPGRVTSGSIGFEHEDLTRVSNKRMSHVRGRGIGMIFQDPGNSLNPVLTVGYQLSEVIRVNHAASGDGVDTLARSSLAAMNIADPDRVMRAYPFQLSGGMQQRVMIALAMIGRPRLLILDEPTSALDVTTQAQLLAVLESLRDTQETSMLFISHDIALLAQIASRIVVMYAGQICESGPRDAIVERPLHPYTRALIAAVERIDPGAGRLEAIAGDPPDLRVVQPGCPFAPRCPAVMDRCRTVAPPLIEQEPGQQVACHLYSAADEDGKAA